MPASARDFECGGSGLSAREAPVHAVHLRDLLADPHRRVEAAQGVLENGADLHAPNAARHPFSWPDHFRTVKVDGSALERDSARKESEDRLHRKALSRSRFADESHGFAMRDIERDILDREIRGRSVRDPDAQSLHGKQRGRSSCRHFGFAQVNFAEHGLSWFRRAQKPGPYFTDTAAKETSVLGTGTKPWTRDCTALMLFACSG